MNNISNTDRIASLQRLRNSLHPSSYLDKIFEECYSELRRFLSSSQLMLVEKLYSLIEEDYKRVGLVGKGYHCLEHSLEVMVLILRSYSNESSLKDEELLEMGIAALLHDYDPYRTDGIPKVERTLYALKTDGVLRDFLERLGVKISNLALLIERTDYPFTAEKEAVWRGSAILNFANGAKENFITRAERLALIDKASTYFCLTPAAARKRVEGLAEEGRIPKDKLLLGTYNFLQSEKIDQLARWVPEVYRKRWGLVERYFRELSTVSVGVLAKK